MVTESDDWRLETGDLPLSSKLEMRDSDSI